MIPLDDQIIVTTDLLERAIRPRVFAVLTNSTNTVILPIQTLEFEPPDDRGYHVIANITFGPMPSLGTFQYHFRCSGVAPVGAVYDVKAGDNVTIRQRLTVD